MTGLEKIIEQIQSESEAEAQKITAAAREKREQILQQAKEEAEISCRKIAAEAEAGVKNRKERADSGAALTERRVILTAKQELVAETFTRAREAFDRMSDAEYFGNLVRMAVRYCLPKEGRICFNARDRKRLPADFADTLAAAVSARGAKLVISDETRPIDGGFILVYGGIEQNCSLSALFDSARETMQDEVAAVLFS